MEKAIDNFLEPATKVFEKNVAPIVNQPMVSIVITWLMILALVLGANELPDTIKMIFTNGITRIILVFLVLYQSTKDFSISLQGTIIVAVGYYILSRMSEGMTLISFTPDIFPGCKDITAKDILDIYGGDMAKAKQGLIQAAVPTNLEINDDDAPLIATYLVNQNVRVSKSCSAPSA